LPDPHDRVATTLGAVAAARLDAAERFPYLAAALFAMTPVVRPNGGTMSVDVWWRCYVDPSLIDRWTHDDFVTGVLHEVWHLIRDHFGRGKQFRPDPLAWNIACDAEINDDLVDAGLTMLATDIVPSDLGCAPRRLAEEYYDAATRISSRRDCGSGAHGHTRPWELGPHDGIPSVLPVEAEDLRAAAAEGLAADTSAPKAWRRWAQARTAPRVDWRAQLRSVVRVTDASVAGTCDYSWARPSRRAAAVPGVVLPGTRRPVPSVAIVVDTSGSVDDASLGGALAEIDGILAALGHRLTPVIACDATTNGVDHVRSSSRLRLAGGGGTDMGAGIAHAGRLRPRPRAVIVITDGHTPWPPVPDRTSVVVCLLPSPVTPPMPPPWAKVVHVQ
jgi:predicted metal-dependent peptidase